MDELVMSEDFTVNEFLEEMLNAKNQSEKDVIGDINGVSVSTEGCTTKDQLQNKFVSAMHNFIQKERNNTPTKRQQDDMTIMLDESIVSKADWDDPSDVLTWIDESTKHLNDSEFARTVYKDGKTPAEVMVEMLKSHGYGEMDENQSETEREINAKISDLENYGFLVSDLLGGDQISLTDSQPVEEEPTTVMERFTGEVEPMSYENSIFQPDEDKDTYHFLSQDNNGFDDGYEEEYDEDEVDKDGFAPLISSQPDPSMLTMHQIESESEELQRQLEAAEAVNRSEVEKESGSDIADNQEKMRAIIQRQQENLQRLREDTVVTNTTSKLRQKPVLEENAVENGFFVTRPKDEEMTPTEENQDFFTAKPKDVGLEEESGEFFQQRQKDNLPVEDEFFTVRTKDSEREAEQEESFFQTKPKNDSVGQTEENEFLQVKPKDVDVKELEEFQEKYGPTANYKEMKIVKRVEKELEDLRSRRQEIKDELAVIQEELKKPTKVVSSSVRIANIENKKNSDLAIQEANEKIRLSTAVTRNNDAVTSFNRATSTHNIIDIIRTSNAIESLGEGHLLSESLTHALEELSKTYYNETVDQLKEQLMEGSRALAEANQLLDTNPDENVYADEITSVRDALKNISTDRSKEKIMHAVIVTRNLKEDNPYKPTIINALDQISNIYYGKTAEEIKNQILDSSRACNEAREELQRLMLKSKGNSENIPQLELDAHYANEALQKAVMNHTKENILQASTTATELDSSSRRAVNKALNQLAVTHLNKNLTELRWEDAKSAMEEAQRSVDPNHKEVIERFNQATKTYTKADIIIALNMAKEANIDSVVSALNKMAIAYYGVDAEELTKQFKNYSKALSEVQNLISDNEIPKDAKENDAMPLFHQAVQSKSEEDIMNALDSVNSLPSYHPLKQPMLDALNAQLILVTREEPIAYEEPLAVNETKDTKNKEELQRKATALLQEYQEVDKGIKKRAHDLNQYAENKEKEKEKIQEPPQKIIDDATNTNPSLFKKACRGAKEALKQIKLKKVAKTVGAAAAIGTVAYTAPLLLVAGYVRYKLLKNPEKSKKQKEEKKQKREEIKSKIKNAFLLDGATEIEQSAPDVEENLTGEEPEQEETVVEQSVPVEQPVESTPSQEGIEFFKAVDDSEGKWWDLINSQEELIHAVVDGDRIGVSINQGQTIKECSSEDVMNYLHNGTLELGEEIHQEDQYEDEEVKRGR